IDRDIRKESPDPERADRSDQSGGRIDDHEMVWLGWSTRRRRTVKDASDGVVTETAHAVIIAGGIIQRTDRRKDGASGRVKGVKNPLNAERSLGGIKHGSYSRSGSLSACLKRVRENKHYCDQKTPPE